jgi:26S proteasome regulatory subunit T4
VQPYGEAGRVEVLKIHASKINKHGDIDYEAIAKIADDFNAADMRNICTEVGSGVCVCVY